MPLPVTFNTVEVRAKFLDLLGTPVVGTVSFTPTVTTLTMDDELVIIVGKTISVELDNTGAIAVELPATNDPDVDPTGFAYNVEETFVGLRSRSYAILVPIEAEATGIDLAVVVPANPSTGTFRANTLGELNDVDVAGVLVGQILVQGPSGEWIATDPAPLVTMDADGTLTIGGTATELATDAELVAHTGDSTGVHGIADTSLLALLADLSAHAADSTAVHGVADMTQLATLTQLAGKLGLTAKAADTELFDGLDSTAFLKKAGGETITISSTGIVGLTLQSPASYTGNFLEFRDSGAALRARFGSAGGLDLTPGPTSAIGLKITSPAAGVTPFIVKGAPSQTFSLADYQNSSGGVVAFLEAAGYWNCELPGPGGVAFGRRRLEVGAADSGGAGFRAVRVTN